MARPDTLDPPTLALVRFAAAIALGEEPEVRERATELGPAGTPPEWVDELLLQSILMVGYPRALQAMAIWRSLSGRPAPADDPDARYDNVAEWTRRGEETCAVVYGENYRRLRENIRALHPAIDGWMITEGYGRILSRPGLDLLRRALCTVVQTAVLETPRQLHSHLRGALNAGASFAEIDAALAIVNRLLAFYQWKKVKELWASVRDSWSRTT